MKKLIIVMLCLGAFLSCGKKQETEEPKTETKVETAEPKAEDKTETETETKEARKVNYVCPMDTNFGVEYSADGQTARLFDESDKIYELKRTEGSEGVYFKDDSGASIRENGDKLTVELVKGTPRECEIFKEEK